MNLLLLLLLLSPLLIRQMTGCAGAVLGILTGMIQIKIAGNLHLEPNILWESLVVLNICTPLPPSLLSLIKKIRGQSLCVDYSVYLFSQLTIKPIRPCDLTPPPPPCYNDTLLLLH